ncbi:hypothetical protein [Bacillus cereus group sp. MG68]|uniref:hypothetical protein n=1 Tax=Bacillus cereus group sp. MG68 TaxID=3040253 RepID=UPI00339448D2
MTKQMTADQMIEAMKNIDNGERLKFLEYLFHTHFDSRPIKNANLETMLLATRNYIEDYIDRDLTEEEVLIMNLAYDTGYDIGWKNRMNNVLENEENKKG